MCNTVYQFLHYLRLSLEFILPQLSSLGACIQIVTSLIGLIQVLGAWRAKGRQFRGSNQGEGEIVHNQHLSHVKTLSRCATHQAAQFLRACLAHREPVHYPTVHE